MNTKKEAAELQEWAVVKRQHGMTDAQVQMARELGMNPKRLPQPKDAGQEPLVRQIEVLYLKRFKKPLPDAVVPLRQLLHDTRARERAEAHERRRRKRQAAKDHAEAARISLLTLRRLCNAIGLERCELPNVNDDLSQLGGAATQDRDAV